MPENSRDLTASGENMILGPDFFGFYASEVKELLSQDDGLLPFAYEASHSAGNLHGVGGEKGSTKNNCQMKENNAIIASGSLFSNGIGAILRESKKERLKTLLSQSVFTLSQEANEMINPVLSVCRIRSCLRCKESLLSSDAFAHNADQPQHPHKKLKALPAYLLDDDLRFILENDSTKAEEIMESHTSEMFTTLHHMEQKLEELLNISMTTCRAMTLTEKQQLRKLIQKLPSRHLDRVAEIIELHKPSDKYSSDEVQVDLDEMVVDAQKFISSAT